MAVIWGTSNSETLNAADGVTDSADTILGLDGNDTIYALNGDDYLKGGGGADKLIGGSGNDTAFYDDSTSAVYIDLYVGNGGGGTASGDTFNSIENLWGSNYDDHLYGTYGDNVLTGGLGNDYLIGAWGNDTLDGGDGTDTIAFYDHDGALTVNLVTGVAITAVGTDTLISIENVNGGLFDDEITGTNGSNTLYGNDGDDELYGAGGHDILAGGAGADVLDGGSGIDTADYSGPNSGGPVTINMQTGSGYDGDAEGDTLTGIEIVIGTIYGDTLSGRDNAVDEFHGGGGYDTLKGFGGADKLYGDAGNDTLNGGTGNDTMYGGIGDDHFVVDSNGDVVIELAGEGTDTVAASANYTLAAGTSIEILKTSVASATTAINLTGNEISNTIYGNAGANILDGGGGADILYGGAGNDTYAIDIEDEIFENADEGTDTVRSSLNNHTLGNHLENLTLLGAGNINGTGNSLANIIIGNIGNNVLDGGLGGDTLQGGGGIDTASYANSNNGVHVDMLSGTYLYGYAEGDTLSGIENLVGSSKTDYLLQGNAGANVIDGGAGNDKLSGRGGADTLIGGAGNDTALYAGSSAGVYVDLASNTFAFGDAAGDSLSGIENLVGSGFADTLQGNDGDNILEGGSGGDQIVGMGGFDTASYAGSAVGVYIDLASNTFAFGDAAGDTLTGIEKVLGSTFADTLQGNDGDNVLEGGAGGDQIVGLGGNDTASYFSSPFGGVYVDLASGTTAFGHAAGDTLSGIENLLGSKFADTLQGNDGDNVIEGETGADTLTGLGGSDTFVLRALYGNETITDFNATAGPGHDIIQFDASEFANFTEVMAWATQVGNDVVIAEAGDQDSLTLTNFVLGNLSADDFMFV